MPIPAEKAFQIVQTAHAEAARLDITVTAVVVDESGRLTALGRMDRARPITVDMAINRAYTAASFQQPTEQLRSLAGQAWFQSLVVSSNGRIMAGGVRCRSKRVATSSALSPSPAAPKSRTSSVARRPSALTPRPYRATGRWGDGGLLPSTFYLLEMSSDPATSLIIFEALGAPGGGKGRP